MRNASCVGKMPHPLWNRRAGYPVSTQSSYRRISALERQIRAELNALASLPWKLNARMYRKYVMPIQCQDDAWNLDDGTHLNIKSPNRNDIVTSCTPGSTTIGEKLPDYSKNVSAAFQTLQAEESRAIYDAPKGYYVPRGNANEAPKGYYVPRENANEAPKGYYVPREHASAEEMPNQCKDDAWNLNDGTHLNIKSPSSNDIVTTCTPGSSTFEEKPSDYINDVGATFETQQVVDSQAFHMAPERYYTPRYDVSTEKNTREEEGHESYCALTAAVSYDVDTEIRVTVPYSDVENQIRMAKRKRIYADGDSGLAKRARENRDSMSSEDDTLIMYDVL